jgi:hypothetical protein
VNGNADNAPLVGKTLDNRLPYPPGAVRREPAALGIIKTLNRLDKPDIPLVDKVQQGQAAMLIFLRD